MHSSEISEYSSPTSNENCASTCAVYPASSILSRSQIFSDAALNELELKRPESTYPNKPTEFMPHFAYGEFPAFVGLDGIELIGGIPIARYVCGFGTKVHLLGLNAKEVPLVDQWIHRAEQEIGAHVQNRMGEIYGFYGAFNREPLEKHRECLVHAATLADLVLAGMICGALYAALGATERAKYPSIFAHYAKVTADEKLKQILGTMKFTEIAVTEPWPFPQT